MTPSEITSLNLQCAERLGWKNVHQLNKWKEGGPQKDGTLVADFNGLRRLSVPNFHGSTDAALQLVAKAKEMGWDWRASSWNDQMAFMFVNDEHAIESQAPTLSAAICLAFLKLPHNV